MSYMRKHTKKTLRDITFMVCLSSKPSLPARVLWEGTAWGHAHTSAHTFWSVVWTSHPKTMFLLPVCTSRSRLQSWGLNSSPCLPSFDNLETSAKIPPPGESSARHLSFSSTTGPQKEKKVKKMLRYKLSFGCLYKRKTGKMVFPQGAYAAVPEARTQLFWGFWLSAAF